MNNFGRLVISLDFELFWGVRDRWTFSSYKRNLEGVHTAVHALLQIFQEFKIHASWAVTGFIFFKNKADLLDNLPGKLPSYSNTAFNPYQFINNLNVNKIDPTCLFAPELIKTINNVSGQEIATHTFSHYYCLEAGQTVEEFSADLKAALQTAKNRGIHIESIVFPRNQYNDEYLKVCKVSGIRAYRGNEKSKMYKAGPASESKSAYRKLLRFIDAYIPLSGRNAYSLKSRGADYPLNIPSSRFLRPYSPQLTVFDILRKRRILSEMTNAAKNHLTYHLWWHPHNFGIHLKENLKFLSTILLHYKKLNEKYGMKSYNMAETTNELTSDQNR